MTKQQLENLDTRSLQAIVASTNPVGSYAEHLEWAKAELGRRRKAAPSQTSVDVRDFVENLS